jgi:hypothetical protein
MAAAPGAAQAAAFDTSVVSAPASPVAHSNNADLSGDGSLVAFSSLRTDFDAVPAALPSIQAYLHDRRSGRTRRLVSSLRHADGTPPAPMFGGRHPHLSANGRWACVDLYLEQKGYEYDENHVALVDVLTGVGTIVPGTASGGAHDTTPVGPGDTIGAGIYVLMEDYCSVADDGTVAIATKQAHAPDDTNEGRDVYTWSPASGTWTLVSRADGVEGTAGNPEDLGPNSVLRGSARPVITPDGRHVAFRSRATHLSAEDDDGGFDIFVRDLESGRTELISRADGPTGGPGIGSGGDGDAYATGSISDDGRLVAFDSNRHGLAPGYEPGSGSERQVYVRDRATGATEWISGRVAPTANTPVGARNGGSRPAISGDGRYVAYQARVRNPPQPPGMVNNEHIAMYDRTERTRAVVSRNSGGAGVLANFFSAGPAVGRDGAVVAFGSGATNLAANDGEHIMAPTLDWDVFVREPLDPGGKLPVDLAGAPSLGVLDVDPDVRFRLNEHARVLVSVTRRGKRRATLRLEADARPGRNRLKIPRRRLRAGRYTVSVRARDGWYQWSKAKRATLTRR